MRQRCGHSLLLALLLPSAACLGTENFAKQWQAALCSQTSVQPYIQFSYHGPITEYAGPICYHFAGYNETCLPAKKRWLTPATRISLLAPGQVPVELLQGYILLIRFPWHSEALYRYAFDEQRCRSNGGNNSG